MWINVHHPRLCHLHRCRARARDTYDPDGIVLEAGKQNGSRTRLSETFIRNIIKNCIGNIGLSYRITNINLKLCVF